MNGVRIAALLLLCAAAAMAEEQVLIDLEALNTGIGLDYEEVVSYDDLLDELLAHRVLLYGEAHDQKGAAHQFLQLVHSLRQASEGGIRIGVEFVDRGDRDILDAYLAGVLDEDGFLERLMPTSLLLSPEVGKAHLEVLRYARRYEIEVLPLESRPAGARPRALRNSEIRWNLATQLGRHPEERLVVLYGVDHVLGDDPITEGIQVPYVVVTSYGDSAQTAYERRSGRYPRPGEVLRLRPRVYLQAAGEPRAPRSIRLHLDSHEELLFAIEAVYSGTRTNMELLIEALDDPEIRWRRAAFDALRFAAELQLGYDPEAGVESRRQAQGRWKAWWKQNAKNLSAAP
ncbi:MAG: ChaN family lipoprotein [Candidatus Krumholzibacteriia bacterium]